MQPSRTTNRNTNGAHGHPLTREPKNRSRARSNRVKRPARLDPYALYLESKLEELGGVLAAARDGDFTVRMIDDQDDVVGSVAATFNDLVQRSDGIVREVSRVSRVMGREGRPAEQATVGEARGAWATCIDSLNSMVSEVAWRTQEVARIIDDVSEG